MPTFTDFLQQTSGLSFPIGEDDKGALVCADIQDLPHLLIAGTTGTGKSIFLHSMLLTLIHHNSAESLRLILFDSKIAELGVYNGIPHLLMPIISSPTKLEGALAWIESEIMKRLRDFSQSKERTLQGYNDYLWESFLSDTGLPRIVVVIDDISFALSEIPEIGDRIKKILLNGRTVGVHLVAVTQTPTWKATKSVSALFRSKVIFSIPTLSESKILIGESGAENLRSCGNAIFSYNGSHIKINTIMATEEESHRILFESKESSQQYSEEALVELDSNINADKNPAKEFDNKIEDNEYDELIDAAAEVVVETGQASVSMLQRRLKLGYTRAVRLVDQLEEKGIVGSFDGSKPRQLLVTKEQWQELKYRRGIVDYPPSSNAENTTFPGSCVITQSSEISEVTEVPSLEQTTDASDVGVTTIDSEEETVKRHTHIFGRIFNFFKKEIELNKEFYATNKKKGNQI